MFWTRKFEFLTVLRANLSENVPNFAINRAAHPSHFSHSNHTSLIHLTFVSMADDHFHHFPHQGGGADLGDNVSFVVADYGLSPDDLTYIHSANMPPPSQSSGSTSASTSSTSGTKKRRTVSAVWKHFELEEKVQPDGRKKWMAICIRCRGELAGESTAGTGHLDRHIKMHARKDKDQGLIQSSLQFNADGQVRNWNYDPQIARDGLCNLIARNDLPLGFGESPGFVKYIQTCHNPNFKPVSRQTTSRDMKKLAKTALKKIKDDFTTCTFSVSLTSDIWSGRRKQDYISVVAHYVNNETWELEKRIIGFELIDVSHTGSNIANKIITVVNQFNLSDNFFAITLDNASSNAKAMTYLTPTLSQYAASWLLHQRCACHVLNLIAKCALKHLDKNLNNIRLAMSWVNASNPRIASYRRFCEAGNSRPHMLNLDMDVRWNSTYDMLKIVIPDKRNLTLFVNSNYGTILLTEQDWHAAEVLLDFLEILSDATHALSGVYYPTSPLMVHKLLLIASHLKQHETDPFLQHAVHKMQNKYLKYWREIPVLYAFAFILDPRANGFGAAISFLTAAVGHNYTDYLFDVKTKLNDIYFKYNEKYAGVRQRRPAPQGAGKKPKSVWSKLYPTGSSSNSSTTPGYDGDRTGELDSYLRSPIVHYEEDGDVEFNLLKWWHDHKLTYPVLSILARDVLTVPVSSTSSESAFSLAGRILEERRACLTPDMVETLMVVKDGELAKERLQHNPVDVELIASFQSIYLDEIPPEE